MKTRILNKRMEEIKAFRYAHLFLYYYFKTVFLFLFFGTYSRKVLKTVYEILY